jgi:HlyD family secretion protein
MDVKRTGIVERKRRRRWLLAGAAVVVVSLIAFAVASLDPAAPAVDRDTVWIGTVESGTLIRQVRGHGTLVPEQLRWVPAPATGRVERIGVDPGQRVSADDVLLELSNPEVERSAVDAEAALRRAEAELESLQMSLISAELDQQAESAAVEAEYVRATLQAEADRELYSKGLISEIQLEASKALAESLVVRREIEGRRLEMTARANQALLDAERAGVEQQRALTRLRAEQLEALSVRAGIDGVVQQVPVQIGQQVAAGATLTLVAEPTRLEAEIRVPATRARDVRPGLPVSVDTRNGLVAGTVARVDPAVREGTVAVEVRLDGELPAGARPDMAVDGTIEIERLPEVLHVGRPVQSQEGATIGLYRLDEDGEHALRVQVELGRASVDSIEVVAGLDAGDRVILSDSSRWDDHDRIRLK